MKPYQYRPVRFYVICFSVTWVFWIAAATLSRSGSGNGISPVLMLLGLLEPAVTAVVTVLTSDSPALKQDLKRKLVGFYRIRPLSILMAVIGLMAIVALSILLSTLFGQSLGQFTFTDSLSFSVGGTSALLTILLAAVIKEVGWRGYGEDSVASCFIRSTSFQSLKEYPLLLGYGWSSSVTSSHMAFRRFISFCTSRKNLDRWKPSATA